ncbi:MAG: transcription termination/antitermination NusG family protein, partial [Bacteroidota bacterium]
LHQSSFYSGQTSRYNFNFISLVKKLAFSYYVYAFPLINCYVFVKITKDEYIKVLETNHVSHFIQFQKNLVSIPEHEIDLLQRILGEGVNVVAERQFFHQGDEVEIVSGSLTGIEGTLVETKGKSKVLVDLQFLGYTLQMHIDPVLLRKKQHAGVLL